MKRQQQMSRELAAFALAFALLLWVAFGGGAPSSSALADEPPEIEGEPPEMEELVEQAKNALDGYDELKPVEDAELAGVHAELVATKAELVAVKAELVKAELAREECQSLLDRLD